ncbi:MAG: septation protein SpoVG family protein [Lachnospiraceae bacterium]|jgi:DNA-binding cell septation regulator SpoVG|nr:septation protein SpoVG family protein [Lachnospiraceae bacterium]MCI2083549.1 septation protein SpoVG family protein [Lachnospiraceae bacterium]MCI2091557.1 septation protein SpoVG family protein [Lachnospiraceae bacterium]
MNIKANMRVDFDSIKNTSTVATGWVEIEGIFKFPVSVRKWFDDKSGKEMMFVSYPQRKDGDKYSGVVYPHDREVRNEIDRVVLEVTKEKLFAESVPDVNIDDVRITPLNQKTDSVVQKLGIASVKMYGMTVNGIVIKEGRKGRFVQMPQYQTQGQYRDTVYGVTAAIQRKIEERVLLEYDKIIRAQEEVNMQAIQEEQKKAEEAEKKTVNAVITFTVAESSEFHSMGTYIDNISTVEEAIEKFNQIDPARLHGIPAIGINYHVEGTDSIEDEQADIVIGKIIDVPSLNAYPDMRDNEAVKAAIEKLIEAYPESLVLSPTEDDVMQTLELAGVAADRKRLDGIYSGTEDREEYLQYLKSLRENYVENDPDEIKMSYLDKAITYVGQIRKPQTSKDENKGIDGAEDATEIQEDEEPIYSSADVITLMPNFFAEKNRDGVRFAIKNTKLNIDNPIIVGKYIRAQCFTVENGNDKVFARFQNELNGMEHMRTGPLLIRQQIVMQVFKDGVPQPPYLYASYKSDNVTEAIEHYNECKGWWTDLTGQTTAEIFQRAKTKENKQNVKQNKPGL